MLIVMGLSLPARILAVALLVTGLTSAADTDFYGGLDAFRREDYTAAMKAWTTLAEGGAPEAQFRVGRLYARGLGTDVDDEMAVLWYGRAAAQGHARAQGALGFMLHAGRGAERDMTAAIDWYRKAATQGRAAAQRNLGEIYLGGDGVETDVDEAVRWLSLAAGQGNAGAQATLGTLHEQGRGVETDPEKAFKLYKKAAKAFHADGEYQLGRAYLEGIGTRREVKKAVRYYSRAASQGHAEAQAALDRLDAGYSANEDPGEAATVAQEAPATALPAEVKSTPSTDELTPEQAYEKGRALMLGDGAPRDIQRASTWLRRAAEAGHPQAAYRLGMLYYHGQIGDRDRSYVEAWLWLHRAAEAGVGDAASWRVKVYEKLTPRERAEVDGTRKR